MVFCIEYEKTAIKRFFLISFDGDERAGFLDDGLEVVFLDGAFFNDDGVFLDAPGSGVDGPAAPDMQNHMADALREIAVIKSLRAVEEKQVAGLDIFEFNRFALLGLENGAAGEFYAGLFEYVLDEGRAVKKIRGLLRFRAVLVRLADKPFRELNYLIFLDIRHYFVGLPGIEPGLRAPHARVLPPYSSPIAAVIFTPFNREAIVRGYGQLLD